jgi:hypothetical protein
LPTMGSSKRASQSSTARLLVMAKLATQRRIDNQLVEVGGPLKDQPVRPEAVPDGLPGVRKERKARSTELFLRLVMWTHQPPASASGSRGLMRQQEVAHLVYRLGLNVL